MRFPRSTGCNKHAGSLWVFQVQKLETARLNPISSKRHSPRTPNQQPTLPDATGRCSHLVRILLVISGELLVLLTSYWEVFNMCLLYSVKTCVQCASSGSIKRHASWMTCCEMGGALLIFSILSVKVFLSRLITCCTFKKQPCHYLPNSPVRKRQRIPWGEMRSAQNYQPGYKMVFVASLKDRNVRQIMILYRSIYIYTIKVYRTLFYHFLYIWTFQTNRFYFQWDPFQEILLNPKYGLTEGLPQALKIQVVHHSLGAAEK